MDFCCARTKKLLLGISMMITLPLYAMEPWYTSPRKSQCIYFSANVLAKEQKNMELFCEQHKTTLTNDLTTLAQKTTEGGTRGVMRKLARGTEFKTMVTQLIGKRHATILWCDKDPERSLHCKKRDLDDDGRLPLWLWAHRKCKNNSLKQLAQLLCVDPLSIAQKMSAIAKEKNLDWIISAHGK